MHLIESVLQFLGSLRDSYDLYCNICKQENRVYARFPNVPHEVITYLLFSIRFEKSEHCDLNFLFLEFIRLGYNPFRKDASPAEAIMIKSVVKIIDKQRLNYGNKKKSQKINK